MIEIRKAQAKDAKRIAEIYNYYVGLGGATFDNQQWTTDQALKLIGGDGIWLVASKSDQELGDQATGDQVIGWASAKPFSARYGYRMSLESAVYIDGRHTGQRLGNRLMTELIDCCRSEGIHYLMARIIAGNDGSSKLHEKLGFEYVGTQREVGRMDDQWLDVILLQKILD